MRLKLAVVTTHPIQYYAPIFRIMARSPAIELRVFYTWSQSADAVQYDAGFGAAVAWDIPLLDGYEHRFVTNAAPRPGVDHFGGVRNPTLVRDIQEWNAGAVMVIGWNLHSHLQVLRHFKGRLALLFRGDSTLLDSRSWWRLRLRRTLLTWVYSHVDVAVAVGANSRDYFSWCGMSDRRIAFAPHSVDVARFAADATALEQRAAHWRSALGVDPEAVVFLFAGKFQEKKDPLLLLRAFLELPVGAHLVFAGSGELEEALRREAADCPAVHFLPFQNQSAMPALYRLADVFVLPSRGPGETWGLALNEAMVVGRALIASSKVGGARDLIQPRENGWIFPAGDPLALGEVLREAVGHGRPGLEVMGTRGRQRIAMWTPEETARLLIDATVNAVRTLHLPQGGRT